MTFSHYQYRDRVVALKPLEGSVFDPKLLTQFMDLFAEGYEKILNEEPVVCAISGNVIEPIVPPEALIMDVSLAYVHVAGRRW